MASTPNTRLASHLATRFLDTAKAFHLVANVARKTTGIEAILIDSRDACENDRIGQKEKKKELSLTVVSGY
jgi:hypothetical protein